MRFNIWAVILPLIMESLTWLAEIKQIKVFRAALMVAIVKPFSFRAVVLATTGNKYYAQRAKVKARRRLYLKRKRRFHVKTWATMYTTPTVI